MRPGCQCPARLCNNQTSSLGNIGKGHKAKNDVVIITIETCGKGKGDKKKKKKKKASSDECEDSERGSRRSRSRSRSPERDCKKLAKEEKKREKQRKKERSKSKDRDKICNPPAVLPCLVPRIHGKGCAMELNILEKHCKSCRYKKKPNKTRKGEDRVGSYECIGRIVFGTCNQSSLDDGAGDMYERRSGRGRVETAAPGMRVYGEPSDEISNWNVEIEEKMEAEKVCDVEAPIQKTHLTDSESNHPRPTDNMELSYKDMRARRDEEEMRNRLMSSERLIRSHFSRERQRQIDGLTKPPPPPPPKKILQNESVQTDPREMDPKMRKKLEKERKKYEKSRVKNTRR